MATGRDAKAELDAERAVNERYQREQEAWLERTKGAPKAVVLPRSSEWTGAVPKAAPGPSVVGPVVGRVALLDEDELLGRDFYIGTWYREWDGVSVVSWAAPVAKLFFDGGGARNCGDLDGSALAARRTFELRNRDLTGFIDDVEREADDSTVFVRETTAFSVPAPPSVSRPTPRRQAPEPPPEQDIAVQDEEKEPSTTPVEPDVIDLRETKELRAQDLVIKAIAKPRTTELSSVLNTLQPAQFKLVTWPTGENLIVQGQPGSGKTIVATHRAGWLTHPSNEESPTERVAVVGPSVQWKAHILAAIAEVGGDGVEVFSLPELMADYSDGLQHELHFDEERFLDTSWDLGRLVSRAVKLNWKQLRRRSKPAHRAAAIVDALAKPTALHAQLATDPEISKWLRAGKSYAHMRTMPNRLPFLAAVGMEVNPPTNAAMFDHIIVDEAQDVRPLEWRMLDSLRRPEGTWSLFGDINQRRSDASMMSWESLDELLELGASVQELETGFRSTNQILKYAGQLLPKGERGIRGLRIGPDVEITKTTAGRLTFIVREELEALLAAYPEGTVAAIGMTAEMRELEHELARTGWKRADKKNLWKHGERLLAVHRPVQARGLEYDGVVVVEPDAFPQNIGRRGRLYTSLTRANQELRIVFTKTMPKELKR